MRSGYLLVLGGPTVGGVADLIHLVRHGEVDNPEHLVYGDLPGFVLSTRGRAQAEAAARHLADRPVVEAYSSPLERALETARVIVDPHQLEVVVLPDLTEWGLAQRWQGFPWEELHHHFPGELQAYLEDPGRLAFSPEALPDMADRMTSAVEMAHARHPEGEVVVVGHQDPLQAARLVLTGRRLAELLEDRFTHARTITLRPGSPWVEMGSWQPPS